jgi:hypothetical protein
MSCEYGAYLVYGWLVQDAEAVDAEAVDADRHEYRFRVDDHLTPLVDMDSGVPIDVATGGLWRDLGMAAWQSGLWAEFWLGVGFRVGDHTGKQIPAQSMALTESATADYQARHNITTAPSWWLILTNEEAR